MNCPHNPDFECAPCATERHAAAHPVLVDGCRVCKFSTIQVSQSVRPKRVSAPPAGNRNSWENGTVKDGRGVPLWDGTGEPIGIKRYAETRHSLEAARDRLAQHPDPFGVNAAS